MKKFLLTIAVGLTLISCTKTKVVESTHVGLNIVRDTKFKVEDITYQTTGRSTDYVNYKLKGFNKKSGKTFYVHFMDNLNKYKVGDKVHLDFKITSHEKGGEKDKSEVNRDSLYKEIELLKKALKNPNNR